MVIERDQFVLIGLLIVGFLLVGCATQTTTTPTTTSSGEAVADWKDAALTDVRTGESFRISDFTGKPVLVESFAVWCPKCTQQQENIKALHEKVGDAVVSVSLDTDPNEDIEIVKNHVLTNGFTWRYAVSPVAVTQALVDEFGTSVVSAPSTPVILVCPDQQSRLLARGIKSVEDLETEIAQGC